MSLHSILLYPVLRRLPPRENELHLTNGISIACPAEEPLLALFREIWVNRCYVPKDVRILPGQTVIDIGANVGVFTIWAAVHDPTCHVLALDPSPRAGDYLRRNILANRLQNVTVLPWGCGGDPRWSTLYSRGPEVLNSLCQQDSYGSSFQAVLPVQIVTLDWLFERFQIQLCSLLKLDCEGSEYEILLNTRADTFRKIQRISMEYHIGLTPDTPLELVKYLESRGYDVQRLPMVDQEGGYLYATRI